MIRVLLYLSEILVPFLIFYVVARGLEAGRPVYEDFIKGAEEGFRTVIKIMPTLVGLMTAVGVLRASGFLEFLAEILAPVTKLLHFPAELVPLAVVRMFSSSAANGLLVDLYQQFGTDSRIGIIASIMMNYIGMYLVNYLIKIAPIYDNVKNQTRPVPAAHRLPTAGLEKIFPDSSANIGIFIVIVVAIIVFILLEKTNFGFELKACGKNRDASIGFGVDAKRMIMTAMLISGALIGLGGALLYLSSAGKYIKVEDVQAAEGMNGIPVALLAMNHPIGIIFTGIFIAYMQVSGFYMQTYGFTTEIVDIIVSVIVYFSAFSFIIREGIRRWQLRQRTDVHHTGKGAEK